MGRCFILYGPDYRGPAMKQPFRLGSPWAVHTAHFFGATGGISHTGLDFSPNCLYGHPRAVANETRTLRGLQWMYTAAPTALKLLQRASRP